MKNLLLTALMFISITATAGTESNEEKAFRAYEKGSYTEAKQLLTEALKERPLDSDLYYYRALAELKLKQIHEAEKDLHTALLLIN